MHDLFKSIVDDFTSLPAKVAAAQAKASEPTMSDQVVMANIETITGLLGRSDITAYASSALQRLLTSLTVEMDRRARERQPEPDYRQALTDLIALVERARDNSDGRRPEPDMDCAVCAHGCAPTTRLCAWHAAKRIMRGQGEQS